MKMALWSQWLIQKIFQLFNYYNDEIFVYKPYKPYRPKGFFQIKIIQNGSVSSSALLEYICYGSTAII